MVVTVLRVVCVSRASPAGGGILLPSRSHPHICVCLASIAVTGGWAVRWLGDPDDPVNACVAVGSGRYGAVRRGRSWNFHVRTADDRATPDYSGRGNVTLFLQLAAAADLFVIWRLGPYICAEWPVGALAST